MVSQAQQSEAVMNTQAPLPPQTSTESLSLQKYEEIEPFPDFDIQESGREVEEESSATMENGLLDENDPTNHTFRRGMQSLENAKQELRVLSHLFEITNNLNVAIVRAQSWLLYAHEDLNTSFREAMMALDLEKNLHEAARIGPEGYRASSQQFASMLQDVQGILGNVHQRVHRNSNIIVDLLKEQEYLTRQLAEASHHLQWLQQRFSS